MIRNIIGILFFIVSGFFVYMVGFLSFFDFPDAGSNKFLMLGGFCIPLLIFHLIGLAFYRGSNWKISTGVTLLSGTALNIFIVITMISIKASDEVSKVMDVSSLDVFNDYLSGFIVMAVFLGLGVILYLSGKSAKTTNEVGS